MPVSSVFFIFLLKLPHCVKKPSLLQLMATSATFWQLMATFGNLWQLLAIYGNLWQLLPFFGNLWQLVVICGNLWQLVTTFDSFLATFGNFANFWQPLATLQHLNFVYRPAVCCMDQFFLIEAFAISHIQRLMFQFVHCLNLWQLMATFGKESN